MKKLKIVLLGGLFALLALAFPVNCFADTWDACELDPNNQACAHDGNVFATAQGIINIILSVVGVIAVVVIIIAGVMMTTSQGDVTKVKKARSAIIYAGIGLVITLAAGGIVNLVLDNIFNGDSSSKTDLTSKYNSASLCTGEKDGYKLSWDATNSKCWGTK